MIFKFCTAHYQGFLMSLHRLCLGLLSSNRVLFPCYIFHTTFYFYAVKMLPKSVLGGISDYDMEQYIFPFRNEGEDRRPTLTFPREIPIEGHPKVSVTSIFLLCLTGRIIEIGMRFRRVVMCWKSIETPAGHQSWVP